MNFINKYKSTYAFLLFTAFSLQTVYGMGCLTSIDKIAFTAIPLICEFLTHSRGCDNPLAFKRFDTLMQDLKDDRYNDVFQLSYLESKNELRTRVYLVWNLYPKTLLLNIIIFMGTCSVFLGLCNQLVKNDTTKNKHLYFTVTGFSFMWQIVNFYNAFTI